MNTKRFLLLPFLALGLLIGRAAQPPPSGKVVLAFDYPAAELDTNFVFRVYGSTNILVPLTNWTVLASAAVPVSTNAGLITFNVPITIVPGPFFFAMTASNFWAESDFSNVASTPSLPRSDSKLSIKRGP